MERKVDDLNDKFLGCLMGCAVGDAMGLPAEGLEKDRIKKAFGEIRDYQWGNSRGYTSDDTELTLLLAESIIEEGGFSPGNFAARLRLWSLTFPVGIGRATLYSGIKSIFGFPWSKSGVKSAGNGSAMRVSPIGLFYHDDPDLLEKFARESSIITHTSEEAVLCTYVVAASVAYLLKADHPLRREDFLGFLGKLTADKNRALSKKIALIEELLKNPTASPEKSIGCSGYCMNSIPFAIYCFLRSPENFEESIAFCVNSGGDTDTNAAICGSLSGVYNGIEGIPRRWIDSLENGLFGREQVKKTAELLLKAKQEGKSQESRSFPYREAVFKNLVFFFSILKMILRRRFGSARTQDSPK